MTEEIDAILFDAGGTLIDFRPTPSQVFTEALRIRGFETSEDAVRSALARADAEFDLEFASLVGKDEGRFWERYDSFVVNQVGFEGNLEGLASDLHERFERICSAAESYFAYPDSRPTLEGLRGRGFRLGIVSNATDLARKVMDALDLSKYFDFMVLSEEVGSRKPSPEIFRMALRAAGTSPNRALYIGDRYTVDVLGAARVGIHGILLDRFDVYHSAGCLRFKDLGFLRRYY